VGSCIPIGPGIDEGEPCQCQQGAPRAAVSSAGRVEFEIRSDLPDRRRRADAAILKPLILRAHAYAAQYLIVPIAMRTLLLGCLVMPSHGLDNGLSLTPAM
jgi:hypothetical protein